MEKNLPNRILLSLSVVAASASAAHAGTLAAWTFENDAVAVNNSPAPSTGTGTATPIGMNIYATPNVGVTTADVTQGSAGDIGTNGLSNLTQIWRVRAQAGTNGAANGWSSLAPIGTQGAIFATSTAGSSSPINVAFDWYATNQGEANMQLEYTTNGTTWHNVAITVPTTDADVALLTNSTSANTVMGSYLQFSGGQQWAQGLTATITDPLAANNPNFAIEMVNASTGTDCISASGTALNNSSGNWRFDNVSISAGAVPEPASLGVLAFGGLALLARRRK
jgi:hypothetical protein